MIEIVDNFLDEAMYNRLRAHADTLSFAGVQNPVDGVVYPGISTDIPDDVKRFILRTLQPRDYTLFMRLSLAGVPVPHQAHTDSLMGTKSLMLYLNRPEHCKGGTSFVKHIRTGMISDPRDKFEEALWKLDTNKRKAWEIYEQVDMKSNRAAIFPSKLMHRAEPSGGFGKDAQTGRLVLTMFYS
jgi:hypothetical protein